jgi:hypothetical protein
MIEARSPEDLVPAFKLLKSERPDVLYVLSAAFFVSQRGRIVELVNAQPQVAVYGQNEFPDAGGLMAYSFSVIGQYRSGATFIDKILRKARIQPSSPSSSRRTSSWYSISRPRKLKASRSRGRCFCALIG